MQERANELLQVMGRVDGVEPGSGLAKHQKMATSPFVMLRGAASVFYSDLASLRFSLPTEIESWPLTMVMGDCHVSNFGLFSEEGSHGEDIIFAPNDFDDACVGHAGWDLLRYGVSLILAADHCHGVQDGRYIPDAPLDNFKRLEEGAVAEALARFLAGYRLACEQLVSGAWDYRQVLQGFPKDHVLHKLERKALKRQAGGEDFFTKSSLAKAVNLEQSLLKFRPIPERFAPLSAAEYRELEQVFGPYVDDQIVDAVERLGAGTGSVNMRRFYLLVGPGKKTKAKDVPLYHIVEVKKQRAAAPLYEFEDLSPINLLSPAHLTVVCQRRMQRSPDLVLDEVRWKKAHWLVRSRHHARVGIDPEEICCTKRALNGGFADYAELCGQALALAHGRSDRRSQYFEQAVLATPEGAWQALLELQQEYAEQVKQDWRWLASIEASPAQPDW